MECEEVSSEVIAATGNSKIDFVICDLSDLTDVQKMATEVKSKFPKLNVLILNAGTFSANRKLTRDGLEFNWAVNYMSRFLLTHLLIDTLKSNASSRIVDVSGMYHAKGKIHFEDLTLEENYSLGEANNQSKLANVLFTYKMARELEGSNVTVNTLHPGAVNSGSILRSNDFSGFMKFIFRITSVFFKTPKQGAGTSVYLASSPDAEGVSGKYFVNSKSKQSSKLSYNKELQDNLWEHSLNYLKEKSFI